MFNSDYDRVISVCVELVRAYQQALSILGFTHYDFHIRNVLVKSENGRDVPVIIDFGSAHVALPEGHLGENFMMAARYNDRSMWTHDFFKLFGMMWIRTSIEERLATAETKLVELSRQFGVQLKPN